MNIEGVSDRIKNTRRKKSTGSIVAATTTSTIFNHATLPIDLKDIYLDKINPQILMTEDNMKPFNTGIPDP